MSVDPKQRFPAISVFSPSPLTIITKLFPHDFELNLKNSFICFLKTIQEKRRKGISINAIPCLDRPVDHPGLDDHKQ